MTLHPSRLAGDAFGLVFRILKTVRPERPIHPRGVSLRGVVETGHQSDPEQSLGREWNRLGRPPRPILRFGQVLTLAGTSGTLPGHPRLALRLPDGRRSADLLFATTGLSVPGRFLLLPHRTLSRAAFTTLMPYRGARGPVLLAPNTVRIPDAARSATTERQLERSLSGGEWVLALSFAKPGGPWRRFGTVTLEAEPGPRDTESRFDPIRNVIPGAETYAWTRRLRERAYAVAQSRVAQSNTTQSRVPKKKARTEMATVSKVFLTPPAAVWKVIADGWLYSGWVRGCVQDQGRGRIVAGCRRCAAPLGRCVAAAD